MTAWIITKDKVADKDAPEGTNCNAKGLIGPSIATRSDVARLRAGEGRKFRMLDDDGNIYYYGRILEKSECSAEYESGFYGQDSECAPFDNFGRPNAGCTQIEYKNTDGKWVGLF